MRVSQTLWSRTHALQQAEERIATPKPLSASGARNAVICSPQLLALPAPSPPRSDIQKSVTRPLSPDGPFGGRTNNLVSAGQAGQF